MRRKFWLLFSVAACSMLVFYLRNCGDYEKEGLAKVLEWAGYIIAQVLGSSLFALATIGILRHVLNASNNPHTQMVQPSLVAKTPVDVLERVKLRGEAKAIREELEFIQTAREELQNAIESADRATQEAKSNHAALSQAQIDAYYTHLRARNIYLDLIVDANRLRNDEAQLAARLSEIADALNNTSAISA